MAWRFLVLDAMTRQAQAELSLVEDVTFSATINSPGAFKARLPLKQPTGSPVSMSMLSPPRAVFAVERDGVLLWTGPIWTHEYDVEGGTLELAGEGYLSYLRRRTLRATKTYTTTEQINIAHDLLTYTQGQPRGDLGIVNAGTATGRLRDRTYYYYERKRIGTLIEQLAAVQDGFDFEFRPRWTSGPNSTLAVDFITTYPALGRATGIVLDLGAVDVATVSLDGTQLAYSVDAIGRGMGDTIPISTQYNLATEAVNLTLDDDVSVGDVEDLTVLTSYALRRLNRGSAPIVIPTVKMGTDFLGTIIVGDQVRVRASYGLLQVDSTYRITGYEVSIPASGPEVMSLTLAPLEVYTS